VGKILALQSDVKRSRRLAGLLALGTALAVWLQPPALAAGVSAPPGTATPEPPPLRLVVNIPAYRLDVYDHGTIVHTFPVTVGMPKDPTPDGRFELQRVIWNPWWHPASVRSAHDHVTPPGPGNPMGKVKLVFAADLYFFHGTPKLKEIGTASSRGCVRMRNQDAVTLARLVHRYAVDPVSPRRLDELASPRNWTTREFRLAIPVPVELRYDLVEVREGELRLYPDVYKLAPLPLYELAARALVSAGYPRVRHSLEPIARVAGAKKAVGLPLATLVLPLDAPVGEVAATRGASPH
jgi:hypothetical protein